MCIPALLKTRRFLPLFITQFLGAFNDNVFKNALVMLITYRLAAQTGENAQILVTLAAALFMLPFLLFSALAGQLADKYDRAFLARIIKIAEIVLMLLAALGFYMGHTYFLLFVLFCTGAQATFFGPIKYALLPQHLRGDELISGNAYIEAGTFLAILFGTILGGVLIMSAFGTHLISAAIVAFALLGYASSRHIPPAHAPVPSLKINWNLAQETWRMVGSDRRNKKVFTCILGISWFWLVGATFLSQFATFAKEVLHGDESVVTLLLTVFSVGIGIGSLCCNWLLKGRITSVYVPIAALGITAFSVDVFFASNSVVAADGLINARQFFDSLVNWRIIADLLMIAICGGIYIVPLYAIMQHDSDPNSRARTIASNNVINALFMVVSAVVTMAMLDAAFSIPHVFLTVGVANIAAAVYISRLNQM